MDADRKSKEAGYGAALRRFVSAKLYYADRTVHIRSSEDMQTAVQELADAQGMFYETCRKLADEGEVLYLEYLLERFGLSEFERHCVYLLYAFETEASFAQAAASLQEGRGYVTPYLAQKTYRLPVDDRQLYGTFAESGLLFRFFLDDIMDEDCLCMERLRLAKRVAEFACGNVAPSVAFRHLLEHWDQSRELKTWIGKKQDLAGGWWEQALEQPSDAGGQFLYLYGEAGCGKRFLVLHECRNRGVACAVISLDRVCRETGMLDTEKQRRSWLRELLREVMLYEEVPVLVSETGSKEETAAMFVQADFLLQQMAELFPVTFLCAVQKVYLDRNYPVTYIQKKPMTMLEGREYWEAEGSRYPIESGFETGSMSNKFHLTEGKISRILENADKVRRQNGEVSITQERVTAECYEMLEQQMGNKTIKVPAMYHMDDLILPKRQKRLLMDACDQVKYKHKVYEEWGFQEKTAYGKGVSMAFAGQPGTGKTMAAQVIANELGLELYKVNLSCVVSKYVGETEKNLEEIFDQAQISQVILFFDEADVLFGRRSEGKESMDKYSNMEAAFLLQKMEQYEGITILATNLFHHFDEAFKRRLKIIVEFPMPDEADRRKLWQTMMPRQMPAGEIDYDYLARKFELSGSNIRNILLHGAVLAASRGKAMDMEELIPAVRNEYAKNGKHLSKSDVSEYFMYLE